MKGKVTKVKKGKGKPSTEPAFIFPGPEGWEAWVATEDGAQCVGPVESPRKLGEFPSAVVCLPSRSFFSVPLWIPVEEGIAPRELAKIALESKNLLGQNPDSAIWAMDPIRTEPVPAVGEGEDRTRQLEAVVVLVGTLEEDWLLEEAGRHEIAGRVLPAPGGGASAVLRKELGRWVIDFYSAGKWLHTQPLLAKELHEGGATEIASLLAQMNAEGTLGPLSLLVLRDESEVSPGTREFLEKLPCPVRTEPRVLPRLSASPWNLEPTVLVDRRLVRAQQGERRKIIRLGVAVYAVLFTAALVYISIPLVRRYLIEKELAGIVVEAEKIRQAALSWREAGALVNPKMNALELLWQVSRPLIEKDPAEVGGVRLTSFDYNTKRLLLQGEGDDLGQTEKYFDWLKKEPMLALYDWKHPQPSVLPNGIARFQTEGLPLGAQVAEEGGADANTDTP